MKTLFISLLCLSASIVQAQWTTATLSQARWNLATAVINEKIFFAGGNIINGGSVQVTNRVDIYNRTTGEWSVAQLSEARSNVRAFTIGSRVFFCGGIRSGAAPSNRIDIYDDASGTWSTAQMAVSRYPLAAVAHRGKLLLAGGLSATGAYSNVVDLYDSATNSWSVAILSDRRIVGGAAAAGNKIVFAGGHDNARVFNTADIYDTETGLWSTARLLEARTRIAAAVFSDQIFFAGGDFDNVQPNATNTIDIYDATTNRWSVNQLSVPRAAVQAATFGEAAIFAGGYDSPDRQVVLKNAAEIFQRDSETWRTDALAQARQLLDVQRLGERLFFTGDAFVFGTEVATDIVEIYDGPTGSWSTERLSTQRYWARSAVAGNQLFVAGGLTNTGVPSDVVDIYTDLGVGAAGEALTAGKVVVFPNPAHDLTHLQLDENLLPARLLLRNTTGQVLKQHILSQATTPIALSGLPTGIYLLEVHTFGGRAWLRIVKQE